MATIRIHNEGRARKREISPKMKNLNYYYAKMYHDSVYHLADRMS